MNARLPNPAISRMTNSTPYFTCRHQPATFRVPSGPNRSSTTPSGQTHPHHTRPKYSVAATVSSTGQYSSRDVPRPAIAAPIPCSGSAREMRFTTLRFPQNFSEVVRNSSANTAPAVHWPIFRFCIHCLAAAYHLRPIGRFFSCVIAPVGQYVMHLLQSSHAAASYSPNAIVSWRAGPRSTKPSTSFLAISWQARTHSPQRMHVSSGVSVLNRGWSTPSLAATRWMAGTPGVRESRSSAINFRVATALAESVCTVRPSSTR
jgi:hypothetical protein